MANWSCLDILVYEDFHVVAIVWVNELDVKSSIVLSQILRYVQITKDNLSARDNYEEKTWTQFLFGEDLFVGSLITFLDRCVMIFDVGIIKICFGKNEIRFDFMWPRTDERNIGNGRTSISIWTRFSRLTNIKMKKFLQKKASYSADGSNPSLACH